MRMASSRPLSDKGYIRLLISCPMMLMLWRYCHTPCGSGLSQAKRGYTPSSRCRVAGLDRRVTDAEYARALDAVEAFGLEGFLQDAESADSSFTPPFDGTGI